MRFATYDRFTLDLPAAHRYPIGRYRLLRELLEADGHQLVEPEAAPWEQLARVHDAGWLARLRDGELSERERRAIGLPWSPQLVERSRRAVGATIVAARDALAHGVGMSLGGGLHHAGRAGGRGFCVLNDMAVAIAALRDEGAVDRVVVLDCDAHQGEGTAELLAGDDAALTISLHARPKGAARRVVPSDVDIPLPAGTGDDAYLDALAAALDRALADPAPALAFYVAGADAWDGDRLGRLGLTKEGLLRRDVTVLTRLRAAGVAVCVLLAGGYAPDVADTVAINAATARAAVDVHDGYPPAP
ncbi:MAG TPA: histone deacetylase [Capillimicrobium sp.]|nr:histone deacetylase [Capillimicrobium sp.]